MKRIATFLLLTAVFFSCKDSKEGSKSPEPAVSEAYDFTKDSSVYSDEMKRYWLVLLKRGNNRNQDSAASAKIQQGHIANINRLAKEGKIIMAGPVGIDSDLRGIFIMDAKDSTEVEALVNTDTAVMTGRLKMEYYPWWSAKGKFVFK